MSAVSDRIKEARRKAGLTQLQLADALGVRQQDVSRWEGGEKPARDAMKSIEGVLGVPLGRSSKKAEPAAEGDRYVQTLCHYRKLAKLTVQQLAAKSGVTDSVISGIENGKLACVDPWVRPLAKALGCQVADIYCGTAGAQEPLGDLPAGEWSGQTTVKKIKGNAVCGWCNKEHEGYGCAPD